MYCTLSHMQLCKLWWYRVLTDASALDIPIGGMIIGGVLKTRVVKHHPMGEANNSLHTNRHTDILRSVADFCNIHVLVMTDCAEGLRTSVPSLHSVITPSDSHSSFDVASHFRHVGTHLSGKSMHTATNTISVTKFLWTISAVLKYHIHKNDC